MTTKTVLRKSFKILGWTLLSLILLLITLALLIQVPAVQTKLVSYVTSYISKKTQTNVQIRKINLLFPKSLELQGLFLDDLQKDTLLYAEKLSVNISFPELLQNKIHLKKINIENVTINLGRKQGDSLFNYNFLITAFSDPSKTTSKDTSKSKWAIGIDKIDLKKISFKYNDEYGGSSVQTYLGELKLTINDLDLDKQKFAINTLMIQDLIGTILIKKGTPSQSKKNTQPLPLITAKKITINNSRLNMSDSINKFSLNAVISDFITKKINADLESQNIAIGSFDLQKSSFTYIQTDSVISSSVPVTEKKANWTVKADDISLAQNAFSYTVLFKKEKLDYFDPQHMNYENIKLVAKNLYYSNEKTALTLKDFAAIDKNNFAVKSLETKFLMTPHSINAEDLKLKTSYSDIDANLLLTYSSLSSLKDSLQFMGVNAEFIKMKVKTSEISYFNSGLTKQSFFQNKENITIVSGKLTGTINNLKGENFSITTGKQTSIKTDFIIAGLPFPDVAYFNFPDLKATTGRNDIIMIAGKENIPSDISLPNIISMKMNFKGKIKSFTSTIGLSSDYGSANIFAILDKNENFTANAEINKFDLGLLLKNKETFGPISLTLKTKGHGFDKNKITAKINAAASELYLNKYTYTNLLIDGNITGQKFEGQITLNDPNAAFDFNGFVNLNKDQEEYKFNFDLKGADLQKLHFSEKDIRIGLLAVSDLKGNSASTINGKAGITRIVIAHNEKKYLLDSLLFASINEKGKSELNISSAVVGIKYNGTFSPADLNKELQKFVNRYFAIPNIKDTSGTEPQNFNFEVQLKNHPVLSEVFFPELKEFEPGEIKGSFDSEKSSLEINASLKKINYGGIQVKNFDLKINSDQKSINYDLTFDRLSNSQFKIDNLELAGSVANNTINSTLSSVDSLKAKKLLISSSLTNERETFTIKVVPENLFIMDQKWNISPDNFISFNKSGVLIHNMSFEKKGSSITVNSVHNKFADDIEIKIKNFQLEDLSQIIEKDTSFAEGLVSGNILLKKVDRSYGLIADASITDLKITEIPVGNLVVTADNPTTEKFSLKAKLTGPENDISVQGYYLPKSKENALDLKVDINKLSLQTAKALSMGKITSASGTANGNFTITGQASAPDIIGSLTFNNAIIKPAALNSNLFLKQETIELKKDGIYFNSFTMLDSLNHPAVINGNIKMDHFKSFQFALNVTTDEFLLFNTTSKNHPVYYGKMIIDSRIKVTGDMNLPVVNSKVKLRKGSNFTFAVPEKKLTTDKGEGIVDFTDSTTFHPIITRNDDKKEEKTELTGLDISSIIEVDKEATLKLLIDPYSGDSLVVRGDAALSFALDPSGKMSLTGAYDLNDGSYLVSLESVLKRKFDIAAGSTIIWNGDPLDATVNINAIYSVRASPIDLVADQLAGLSETEQSGFKQRYPFLIYLKLRGDILHPEISFEIQLPPEEKGILGGAVNAKLNMLNEDPSALNKQVFALLVLGRFVQEDPLQTETNAVSTVARTTVSKFLSAQLNQLSSKVVPGVELNFDVQSYDDYGNGSGQAEGRTEVEIGVKKQLFNERLTVQVGGSVDVEGERAKQNSASDITSDVSLEYKLSKDGRYRLKGFRHNQYEGAIEGQLVETGAGILYIKDFDKWKEFFRPNRKKKEGTKKNKNETISNK
ncbi:MAG: hypothetical protein K0S44_1219 [Bacteroidetes bacterium]|jgi:hypothetical protein|nr:hypothetical protein [Bacteroidota bacterium]